MEQITLGQLGLALTFIVGLISGIGYIRKHLEDLIVLDIIIHQEQDAANCHQLQLLQVALDLQAEAKRILILLMGLKLLLTQCLRILSYICGRGQHNVI